MYPHLPSIYFHLVYNGFWLDAALKNCNYFIEIKEVVISTFEKFIQSTAILRATALKKKQMRGLRKLDKLGSVLRRPATICK